VDKIRKTSRTGQCQPQFASITLGKGSPQTADGHLSIAVQTHRRPDQDVIEMIIVVEVKWEHMCVLMCSPKGLPPVVAAGQNERMPTLSSGDAYGGAVHVLGLPERSCDMWQ
jgi:hypothetical protein